MRGTIVLLAALLCTPCAVAAPRHAAIVIPVGSSCISSPFGPRVIPNHPEAGTYHNGIDLPAAEGTPVHAVSSGKLLRIDRGGPGGLEVLIDHDGFVGVYSHLASISPDLNKGLILAGSEVGIVGRTGVSFGPHLFFAMLINGKAVDPAPLLGVPACNGAPHQPSPAQILAAGGKLPPTRRYLDLRITVKIEQP